MFKTFFIVSIPLMGMLVLNDLWFHLIAHIIGLSILFFIDKAQKMSKYNFINKSYFYIYSFKCHFLVPYYLELGNKKILLAFLLTLLGWIPGVIYAVYLIKKYFVENTMVDNRSHKELRKKI